MEWYCWVGIVLAYLCVGFPVTIVSLYVLDGDAKISEIDKKTGEEKSYIATFVVLSIFWPVMLFVTIFVGPWCILEREMEASIKEKEAQA